MNFFRKLRRPKISLSISDDTHDKENGSSKGRPLSSNLRRSGGLTNSENYHTAETKLFEEPLHAIAGEEISSNHTTDSKVNFNIPSSHLQAPAVESVNNGEIDNDIPHHASLAGNEDINQNMTPGEQKSTSHHVRLPSSLPDEEEAQEMKTLYASIIRGEKSSVKKFLNDHPHLLDAPDTFGRTPLMYCVLSDRIDCAKYLLKMKANMHQKDKAGRSALHLAAHKGSYKFVELLHAKGANIKMKDNDGQTPLHLITRNRHVRCLDFLLRHLEAGMAEVADNQNRTALHWSAAFNNEESVRLLIKYQCNPAVSDNEGKTPLHWAANTHDPAVVPTLKTLLCSSPSALNWQDYDGRTALHFAVAHENVAAVEFFINFDQEKCEVNRLDNTFRTPLHWAAQLGNSSIVQLLLSAGAKNSISDEYGATPLLYAALHNKHEVISVLLHHDSNVLEQADIEGRTALMWAAGKGANDVIKLLLDLNNAEPQPSSDGDPSLQDPHKSSRFSPVDVNRADNKGNAALHMAALNGHDTTAQLLLASNSNHDLLNNMNHTPLFAACEKGHLSVVEGLIDNNANVHLRDLEERTPLHWAAIGGHAEVCDLLIKTGLDPDVRDNSQRTPLHCAAFGGFINCMNVLLENRANVDLQDQGGMSALHWGAQSGHLDVTKLLFQCSAFPNLMEYTEERLTPLDHALLHGNEEVALYFIEQGALSSEAIRDIAAARIQACYRGYQVRKGFLNRKNLLIQHEMLRNQKDRNRAKKKTTTSSSDQINVVDEEPTTSISNLFPPESPPLFGDEISADLTMRSNAKVVTIPSASDVIEGEILAAQPGDDDQPATLTLACEEMKDQSPTPHRIPTPDLSLIANSESHQKKENSVLEKKESPGEGLKKEDLDKHEDDRLDCESPLSADIFVISRRSGTDKSMKKIASDFSALPSPDTSDDDCQQEKKKKKKRKTPILNRDSTASDLHSTETRKKKRKSRDKRTEHMNNLSAPINTDSKRCKTTSAGSTSSLIHLSSPGAKSSNIDFSDAHSPVSRLDSEHEPNHPESSHLHSSLNDLDNIGTDDKIAVDPVNGLAYSSSLPPLDHQVDSSCLEHTMDMSLLNDDLTLSEYIESLMSLSLSERKMLTAIQRNRKVAFQRANTAATMIQAAWRRYFMKKYPDRIKKNQNCSSSSTPLPPDPGSSLHHSQSPVNPRSSSRHSNSPADRRLSSHPSDIPPDPASSHHSKSSSQASLPRSRSSSFHKVEKPSRESSSKRTRCINESNPPAQPPPTNQVKTITSKKKKPKRPRSSVFPFTTITDNQFDSPANQDTISGLIVSDVDSDYLVKTNKVRAKTSHEKKNRTQQDDRSNRVKIDQLHRVYGRTVLVPAAQKRKSSKFPVRPRPGTTKSTLRPDFNDPEFYNPNLYEPITAVQSYNMEDCKIVPDKKNNKPSRAVSPSRKNSMPRKSQFRVKSQSTQWKKSYGGGINCSVGSKSSTTSATRFSYNMRSAKM